MRTEDKVMNNGKLQAKQEKLKSLHCPSPQSSLFDSRGSSLRSQIPSLCSYSAVLNSDQSARSVVLNPQHSKESATGCSKHNGELAIRSPQNNDESEIRSPQQLFIDVSNELLRRGQCVRFQAPGQSMHPTIKEGETITIAPVALFNIKRGDILLYIVGRKIIAHRVVRIKREKSNSKSHSSANFATQSASDASANSSIRPATPSLAHSSTHSSTRASIHSMALNPRLVFILRGCGKERSQY